MYLPVAGSHKLLVEVISQRLCCSVTGDTPCVNVVLLWQIVLYPCVLGYIPIGMMNIWIKLPELIVERPAHDTHESGVFE